MSPLSPFARLPSRITRPDIIRIAIACVAVIAMAATMLRNTSRTIVLAAASILWLGLPVDAFVRHPPAAE